MVTFSCFCICLWNSCLSIVLLALDCVVFPYVMCPYLLLAVSPLALFPLYFHLVYLFADLYFGKFVYKFFQLVACHLFVVFHYLIPEVIFCRCDGGHHILLGFGYDASGPCHCNPVASPILVFWYMSDHCSMCSRSPIFALHHYSWSCRCKRDFYTSICLFGWGCLLFNAIWLQLIVVYKSKQ